MLCLALVSLQFFDSNFGDLFFVVLYPNEYDNSDCSCFLLRIPNKEPNCWRRKSVVVVVLEGNIAKVSVECKGDILIWPCPPVELHLGHHHHQDKSGFHTFKFAVGCCCLGLLACPACAASYWSWAAHNFNKCTFKLIFGRNIILLDWCWIFFMKL